MSHCIEFSSPLNALSYSPNKKLIAVGGRDVLKIITYQNNTFEEKINLRNGKNNINFTTNDLRWHPQAQNLLASASSNGTIFIWNLSRNGLRVSHDKVFNEHQRSVNKVRWHPADFNLLISGSQDGTLKLWDRRGNSTMTYYPKSESIRNVQFSNHRPNKFSVAFDNGIVQIWDTRKLRCPEIKFTAHKGPVLTLDWHPKKVFTLATGSRDRTVKSWNVGNTKQPEYIIHTIASVGCIQWRPDFPNQIASGSSTMDDNIYLWDFTRPNIPLVCLKAHSDAVTCLEWYDSSNSWDNNISSYAESRTDGNEKFVDQILSCSKDGTLRLNSITKAYFPYEHISASALGLNVFGQIALSRNEMKQKIYGQNINSYQKIKNAEAIITVSSFDHNDRSHDMNGITANISRFCVCLPDIFGFSSWTFSFLASHYILHGKSFPGLCEHNSEMALVAGLENLSKTWRMMEIVFLNESFTAQSCKLDYGIKDSFSPDKHNVKYRKEISISTNAIGSPRKSISSTSSPTNTNRSIYKKEIAENQMSDLLQQLDNINPQALQTFEASSVTLENNINLSKSNVEDSEKISPRPNEWGDASLLNNINKDISYEKELFHLQDTLLKEIIEYYSNLGDVQSCAAITMVVNSIKKIDNIITKQRLQQMYMNYIDLLHQLKLYVAANDLIKHCPDKSIRQINMKSTSIYTSCSKCGQTLDGKNNSSKTSSVCTRCQSYPTRCSICLEVVKGLYSWCSVCSHGGHLHHLTEWFRDNDMCPTGCMHVCSIK